MTKRKVSGVDYTKSIIHCFSLKQGLPINIIRLIFLLLAFYIPSTVLAEDISTGLPIYNTIIFYQTSDDRLHLGPAVPREIEEISKFNLMKYMLQDAPTDETFILVATSGIREFSFLTSTVLVFSRYGGWNIIINQHWDGEFERKYVDFTNGEQAQMFKDQLLFMLGGRIDRNAINHKNTPEEINKYILPYLNVIPYVIGTKSSLSLW